MVLVIKLLCIVACLLHGLTLYQFVNQSRSPTNNTFYTVGFVCLVSYLALGDVNHFFRGDVIAFVFLILVNFLSVVIYQYTSRHLKNDKIKSDVFCDMAKIFISLNCIIATSQLIFIGVGIVFLFINIHQIFSYYKHKKGKSESLVQHYFRYIVLTAICLMLSISILYANHITAIDQITFSIPNPSLGSLSFGSYLLLFSFLLLSIPLLSYDWITKLTDAPTSMSMLLHAGVINLGCYLVLSLFYFNQPSVQALWLVFCVAALSLVISKIHIIKEIAFKNQLAHSTIAQMGFCLIEISLGFYSLAVLHLIGHAFYKAYLFSTNGNGYAFNASNHVLKWGLKTSLFFLFWLMSFAFLYHLIYGGAWSVTLISLPNLVAAMVVTYLSLSSQFYSLSKINKYGLIAFVIISYQFAEWLNHMHFFREDASSMVIMQILTGLLLIVVNTFSKPRLIKMTSVHPNSQRRIHSC
jgi:NAD(P)H-quinone oxidoreductase subunit 5